MKIIEKRLDELKPYKRNPRKNDDAVPAVAASIKEFGFKVPLVIDKNGEIVCGHTRAKAAKKLGLVSVPCVIADDLTQDQIKAFRLVENKTQEASMWDFDLLDLELPEIDMDMSVFGFEDLDSKPTQTLNNGGEITLDSFSDDKFQCTCPKCGFKFNPKG